jgi:hypothetical protein
VPCCLPTVPLDCMLHGSEARLASPDMPQASRCTLSGLVGKTAPSFSEDAMTLRKNAHPRLNTVQPFLGSSRGRGFALLARID